MIIIVVLALLLSGCAEKVISENKVGTLCKYVCPVGDIEDRKAFIEGCCTDMFGETWSACAWNTYIMYILADRLRPYEVK